MQFCRHIQIDTKYVRQQSRCKRFVYTIIYLFSIPRSLLMDNLISAEHSTSSREQIRAAFSWKTPYCHLCLPGSAFETRQIIIVSATSLTTPDKWIVDLARKVRKDGLQLLTWCLLMEIISRKTPLQWGDHWGWWLAMVCSSERKLGDGSGVLLPPSWGEWGALKSSLRSNLCCKHSSCTMGCVQPLRSCSS